jgi:hypothetical protein
MHSHSLSLTFSSGQVFYNWKGQLRTRAKKLKQIQDGKTGVDDKLALQKLTDVEKRALKLWKEDFQDKDIASVSKRGRESLFPSFFRLLCRCFVCIHVYRFPSSLVVVDYFSSSLFRCLLSLLSLSLPSYKKHTQHSVLRKKKEKFQNYELIFEFAFLFEANTQ